MSELNFKVNLDEYDCWDCGNGAKSFVDDIMNRIACEILNNRCGDYDAGDYYAMVNDKVKQITDDINQRVENEIMKMMKKEYLQKIADTVSKNLEGLFEKSKAYRELKNRLDVEQDRMISSGLRAMVKDVVAEEVRKMIRV